MSSLQEDSIYWEQLTPACYIKELNRYKNEEHKKQIEREKEIQTYREKVISDIRNNNYKTADEIIRNQYLPWKYVYLRNNNIYETLFYACETSEQRVAWFQIILEKDGIQYDSEKMDCFIMALAIKDIELIKILTRHISPDINVWKNSPRETLIKMTDDKSYVETVLQIFDA